MPIAQLYTHIGMRQARGNGELRAVLQATLPEPKPGLGARPVLPVADCTQSTGSGASSRDQIIQTEDASSARCRLTFTSMNDPHPGQANPSSSLTGVSRFVLVVVAFVASILPGVQLAAAQSAGCQFVLGFQTLHDLDPTDVGDCTDNQSSAANGDAQQHTSKGLMVWWKADNWTAFTNGYMTWINGPTGLSARLNTQRFSWEANPAGLPLADGSGSSTSQPPAAAKKNATVTWADYPGVGHNWDRDPVHVRTTKDAWAQTLAFLGSNM